MSEFLEAIREASDMPLDGVTDGVILAMAVIVAFLVIASIVALVVSIFLSVSYIRYNRKKASCGKTGEQVAREILDRNGLQNIHVSKTGSILFGNSYSHFFKKVRLRRMTWKKDSVTSLSMAAQKSSLAVLDKEGDPDMKARVKMTPFIYFGPLAFIPLILIGSVLDLFVFHTGSGLCTILAASLGLVIYIISFVMSVLVLKTEKKAQSMALRLMKQDGLATDEEIEMSRKLFRLYNIEYINDMVIALLELIYRILQIVAYVQGSSSSSGK